MIFYTLKEDVELRNGQVLSCPSKGELSKKDVLFTKGQIITSIKTSCWELNEDLKFDSKIADNLGFAQNPEDGMRSLTSNEADAFHTLKKTPGHFIPYNIEQFEELIAGVTEEPHDDILLELNTPIEDVCEEGKIIKHIRYSQWGHKHDMVEVFDTNLGVGGEKKLVSWQTFLTHWIMKKTGEEVYIDVEISGDNWSSWRRASASEVDGLLKVKDPDTFTHVELLPRGEGVTNRRLRRRLARSEAFGSAL